MSQAASIVSHRLCSSSKKAAPDFVSVAALTDSLAATFTMYLFISSASPIRLVELFGMETPIRMASRAKTFETVCAFDDELLVVRREADQLEDGAKQTTRSSGRSTSQLSGTSKRNG